MCCRYEIEGCEVIWAIKDKSISSTFIDPGAATFFLPHLADDKTHIDKPSKRLKYTEEGMATTVAGFIVQDITCPRFTISDCIMGLFFSRVQILLW